MEKARSFFEDFDVRLIQQPDHACQALCKECAEFCNDDIELFRKWMRMAIEYIISKWLCSLTNMYVIDEEHLREKTARVSMETEVLRSELRFVESQAPNNLLQTYHADMARYEKDMKDVQNMIYHERAMNADASQRMHLWHQRVLQDLRERDERFERERIQYLGQIESLKKTNDELHRVTDTLKQEMRRMRFKIFETKI